MDLQVSRELSILKFNDKLSLSLAGKATLNDLTNFQPILLDLAKPRLMFIPSHLKFSHLFTWHLEGFFFLTSLSIVTLCYTDSLINIIQTK